MASGLRAVLGVARRVIRDLGLVRATGVFARKAWRKLRHERPPNTVEANLEVWETHDWSRLGEEWTPSQEWKEAILNELLRPHIPAGSCVLEIGPGAGRWTEYLIPLASRLILVDITPACIALCRARFASESHIEYHVNDGRTLPFVSAASVDAIWSFDTFVHIEPRDIHSYVREFARVLRPGGVAVVHHARCGCHRRSWRSDMTAEQMVEFCNEAGLVVVRQQVSLAGGTISLCQLGIATKPDVVSVIQKPLRDESPALPT